MNTHTHLVVFTQAYPYGHAEPFIGPELNELAKHYRHITVVPLTARAGRPLRELPSRVQLLEIFPLAKSQVVKAGFHVGGAYTNIARGLTMGQRLLEVVWLNKMAVIAEAVVSQLARLGTRRIYYGYWLANTAAVAALVAKRDPHAVAVARAHGGDLYPQRAQRGFHPGRRLHRQLAQVFPISQAGKDSLRHQGFAAEQLHVSRLGVTPSAPAPYRPEAHLKIATCSNAATVKRLELIAAAVGELSRLDVPIRWLHIGETRLAEGEICELLRAAGCSDDVLHSPGRLPASEVRTAMRAFAPDVFINASSTEGVPVAVMEAFSLGLPVVATAAGGTGEIVSDGINGCLLPVSLDATTLANAIADFAALATDDQLAYRTAALTTWQERCNAAVNYRDFASLLQGLFDAPRR